MSNAKTDRYIRCSQCHSSVRPVWTSKAVRCPCCDNLIKFSSYDVRPPTSTDDKCSLKEKFQNKIKSRTLMSQQQRKRAVLCGVSYKKKKYELKGTVNDVKNMRDLLIRTFGFQQEAIRVLTEYEKEDHNKPTRRNIRNALQWLVKDCRSGDSLVFFFSGHGLRHPERVRGDEADGYDESICPVDFVEEGCILDDEINETIVRPLPKGVTLHAIVDAFHSGTVLDLPYQYDIQRGKWQEHKTQSGAQKGTSGGLAISISACADDEIAADTPAFSWKNMPSAMTMRFVQAIQKTQGLTYTELFTFMQVIIVEANKSNVPNNPFLPGGFHAKILQEAALSSSEEFNANKKKFQL